MEPSLRRSKAAWKYFLRPVSISNHHLFFFLSQGSQIFKTHYINVKINTSTSNQYLVPSPWGYAEGRSASRSCSSWPRSRGRGWSSCPRRGWTGRPRPSSGSGSGSLAPAWSALSCLRYCSIHNQEIQKVNCAIVQAFIFYLWEWWDMPEVTCTTLRMTRSPAQQQREVTCTTTESTKSPETLADCRTRKRPSLKPPSRRAYIYKYKNTTTDPAKMDQEELFF